MQTLHERRRFYWGGIAGGCFIGLTQLVTRDVIQPKHLIALECFAFVLPFAAMFTLWPDQFPITDLPEVRKKAFKILAELVALLFWFAMFVLFSAFGLLPAVIFVGSTLAAMITGESALKFLKKCQSKNSQK